MASQSEKIVGKVLFLGKPGTGKTTIISETVGNNLDESDAVVVYHHEINIENVIVVLKIFDTRQILWESMKSILCYKTNIFVLVFDTGIATSIAPFAGFIKDIKENCQEPYSIITVGNHKTRPQEVLKEGIDVLVEYTTSTYFDFKNNQNAADKIFDHIAKELIEMKRTNS